MNYSYLVYGTKLSALKDSGEGLVYRGPFVYRKSAGPGNSSLTLESAAFGGGRLTPSRAMLYVTDYLGSVRAVVDGQSGELYKASDYSAFGEENDVVVPQHGIIPTTQLATATLPDGTTIRDGYTGKEDQSHDFGTSYTDFGARQYNPSLRRWMIPDPLSEKYYGISPYAFCNNNPVNLVDLDGRRWVNKQGQIVCDINGPTVHATSEEVEWIKAMNSIPTGRKQLGILVDAPFDVVVWVNPSYNIPENGVFKCQGPVFNKKLDRYIPQYYDGEIITFGENAKKRSQRHGISYYEALAANLGHEIEHITAENLKLKANKASKKETEAAPNQISKDMIYEFKFNSPLPSIDNLLYIIELMLRTELNRNVDLKQK